MKDMIDERNFHEQCARSIVKSYNVHYLTAEEAEAQKREKEAKDLPKEENPKAREMVFEADERYAHMPSSQYGTTAVDDPVTKEQIERILGERKNGQYQ